MGVGGKAGQAHEATQVVPAGMDPGVMFSPEMQCSPGALQPQFPDRFAGW